MISFSFINAGACIFLGLGWIVGFVVRWSVHKFYIDPMGHCVTPVPYAYSPRMAYEAMHSVEMKNVMDFLKNFTAAESRAVGSDESRDFAHSIAAQWRGFGLSQVELVSWTS